MAAQRAKALADERSCERNPLCGSNGVVDNKPEEIGGPNNTNCQSWYCDPRWQNLENGLSIGSDLANPPNPSPYALLLIAALLHLGTAITELALVGAEVAIGFAIIANPALAIVLVPLGLTLFAAGMFILDFDIAFLAYTYRVTVNPDIHQEIEFLPPWGLDQ
jgi:hypothetical protein